MIGIGSIALVKNVKFGNNKLDHAALHGRPVVIAHFDDQNIYAVPLGSYHKYVNSDGHLLVERDLDWKKQKYHKFYINALSLLVTPYKSMTEVGIVDPDILRDLLLLFMQYHPEMIDTIGIDVWYNLEELNEILEYDKEDQLDALRDLNDRLNCHYVMRKKGPSRKKMWRPIATPE